MTEVVVVIVAVGTEVIVGVSEPDTVGVCDEELVQVGTGVTVDVVVGVPEGVNVGTGVEVGLWEHVLWCDDVWVPEAVLVGVLKKWGLLQVWDRGAQARRCVPVQRGEKAVTESSKRGVRRRRGVKGGGLKIKLWLQRRVAQSQQILPAALQGRESVGRAGWGAGLQGLVPAVLQGALQQHKGRWCKGWPSQPSTNMSLPKNETGISHNMGYLLAGHLGQRAQFQGAQVQGHAARLWVQGAWLQEQRVHSCKGRACNRKGGVHSSKDRV